MSVPGRGVVIALDAPSLGEVAFDLARHVVEAPALEMIGLFVEDELMLSHARSPLAREVALTGVDRPLETGRLERQLRAQAAQVRGVFESAAARAGATLAFRIARGELVRDALLAAADAAALVVASTRQDRWRGAALRSLARAPLRTLLFARESWLTGNTILAVLDSSDDSREILRVATRLAGSSRSPLRVLRTGEAAAGAAALPDIREMRARGISLQVLPPAARATPETLARVARDARVLILPSQGHGEDETLIGELLAKTRAALVLVRR